MSELPEGVLPEDETQVLGQIIDLIGREKPDLGEAIRLCAIPHWFNKKILAWLRGEKSKPSERTETILDELKSKKLAFIGRRNLFLHDNVRNLLLQRWRKEKPQDFQALNGKVAAYYEYELQQPLSTSSQRAEWEREHMYHLLVAERERGIGCFKNLCNKAIYSYRLSTLDLLFSIASEQVDIDTPSTEIQLWIKFFEGKKNQVASDWDKALAVWEELKEQRVIFTGDLEQTLAVHLSILYRDKGDWSKSIESLEDSLKILEGKGDGSGMITILNNRGFLYKDRADLLNAKNDFQRSLAIARKLGDKRGEAVTLKNLGILYKDNKNWDEALEQFRSSLAILEKTGDEHLIARAYDDRALFYKDRGLWRNERNYLEEAENDFRQALVIMERIGDEHEKAAAFNSLGLFYKDRGLLYKAEEDLRKADKHFERAREILEKIGDQRRMADIFNSLGFLHTAEMEWHDFEPQFQKALTNFQEALMILKHIRDERGAAAVLNNLGLLYQHKGKIETAIDYFQQSLVIVKKVGDKMNAATTMYELASLYEAMADYDKAIELLNKVVKISERVGHPDGRIIKSREKLEMVKAKASSGKTDHTQ
jgi:tetratricopeptide (TPR) repeat protein